MVAMMVVGSMVFDTYTRKTVCGQQQQQQYYRFSIVVSIHTFLYHFSLHSSCSFCPIYEMLTFVCVLYFCYCFRLFCFIFFILVVVACCCCCCMIAILVESINKRQEEEIKTDNGFILEIKEQKKKCKQDEYE